MHAVTGAFGYSGKYITKRLLAEGQKVITLTNSPQRIHEFGEQVSVYPFYFDQPEKLVEVLDGVQVLYNTYWVRFNHRRFSHAEAVKNTQLLFEAARWAGVNRVVHVSITNPAEDSPLEYFSGKAYLERVLRESGLSYAILRPTVLFGKADILINNIAWALRHLPFFGVFGDGRYKLQPIYVDDLAALAVEQGKRSENSVVQAIGPETFSFINLVRKVGEIIGKPKPIIPVPPAFGYLAGWAIGKWMGDVLITREEVAGLMANLLYVDAPPTGTTRLTDWAREQAETLGSEYASELRRRRDRIQSYTS